MNTKRHCNMERPFHGTCLNLCLGMACSEVPNSLCMRYADNSEIQSIETKERIQLAKEMGIYSDTCAAIGFDILCNICGELVDAYKCTRNGEEYTCKDCQ